MCPATITNQMNQYSKSIKMALKKTAATTTTDVATDAATAASGPPPGLAQPSSSTSVSDEFQIQCGPFQHQIRPIGSFFNVRSSSSVSSITSTTFKPIQICSLHYIPAQGTTDHIKAALY